MQSNKDNHLHNWLHRRGITDEVISLFGIVAPFSHPVIGDSIKIPFSDSHSKYRRDPNDERKPKYVYDQGGKVTLYGYDHLSPATVSSDIVITEGELDTLVLWSKNIPAVSSTGGAMSFQEEWVELIAPYNVYLCFDNDDAGMRGMVKVLKMLPKASVILIPELPDVKDISDYVSRGGDFRLLMDSALHNLTIESVSEDMGRRKGMMLSTRFHRIYLDEMQQALYKQTYEPSKYDGYDKVLKARGVPMTNFIQFKHNKVCCPWHNEKTPSLQYYPKTNTAYCFGQCGRSYDAIDAYMLVKELYGKQGFKQAIKDMNV